MKLLLVLAAVIEAGAGLALLLIPTVAVSALLGAALDTATGPVAGRIAGAALISLAIACWQARNGERGTVPAIEKERYFSIQLIDAYTQNFDYIGSRATGNDGGSFLIAGPNWKGETTKGLKKVIRSETEFVFAIYRTQLINPGDLDNVKRVQAGYKAQPLSAFLGQPAPKAAPAIDFIKPLTPAEQKTSMEFFNVLKDEALNGDWTAPPLKREQ